MLLSRTFFACVLASSVLTNAPALARGTFYTSSDDGRSAEIVGILASGHNEYEVVVRWREPWGSEFGITRHEVDCENETVVNRNLRWSPTSVVSITPWGAAPRGYVNFSYDLYHNVCYSSDSY